MFTCRKTDNFTLTTFISLSVNFGCFLIPTYVYWIKTNASAYFSYFVSLKTFRKSSFLSNLLTCIREENTTILKYLKWHIVKKYFLCIRFVTFYFCIHFLWQRYNKIDIYILNQETLSIYLNNSRIFDYGNWNFLGLSSEAVNFLLF